jgi:hypothetical protein
LTDGLAAIQGDFVDLRFVKGRKVCQIVIETPIEAGGAIVSAFGTPDPAITIPVVLARMNGTLREVEPEKIESTKALPEQKGGKLSRDAAFLCQTGSFHKFLIEHAFGDAKDIETATDILRNECGVQSRAELDHNQDAARRFREIKSNYDAWMMAA